MQNVKNLLISILVVYSTLLPNQSLATKRNNLNNDSVPLVIMRPEYTDTTITVKPKVVANKKDINKFTENRLTLLLYNRQVHIAPTDSNEKESGLIPLSLSADVLKEIIIWGATKCDMSRNSSYLLEYKPYNNMYSILIDCSYAKVNYKTTTRPLDNKQFVDIKISLIETPKPELESENASFQKIDLAGYKKAQTTSNKAIIVL